MAKPTAGASAWRSRSAPARPLPRPRTGGKPARPRLGNPLRAARVLALRRRKLPGFQIARRGGERDKWGSVDGRAAAKLAKATVSRLLRRPRLRLAQLSPPPPVVRYAHAHPGDLLHFDSKKLARIERPGHRITGDRQHDHVRGAGWDISTSPSTIPAAWLSPSSSPMKPPTAPITFLHAALAFFQKHGVKTQRVYSDNGSCYRAHAMRAAVAALGLKHRFTRPSTPKTNGKAERFIQTSLRAWAYAHA